MTMAAERDDARASRDAAIRREQKLADVLAQVIAYIEDALLYGDDLGLVRGALHASLEVHRNETAQIWASGKP